MDYYQTSVGRRSGAVTISEQRNRLDEAFKAGQRDAEQGWPADATIVGYTQALAAAYHAGFCQPRVRNQ